jgi:hypothetical protein
VFAVENGVDSATHGGWCSTSFRPASRDTVRLMQVARVTALSTWRATFSTRHSWVMGLAS